MNRVNRLALVKRILSESNMKIEYLMEWKINVMLEICGIKSQAYDRINKAFMEDS